MIRYSNNTRLAIVYCLPLPLPSYALPFSLHTLYILPFLSHTHTDIASYLHLTVYGPLLEVYPTPILMITLQTWNKGLDPGPYKQRKMNLHNWQLHFFLSFRIVLGSLFFMSRMQYVKKKKCFCSVSLSL